MKRLFTNAADALFDAKPFSPVEFQDRVAVLRSTLTRTSQSRRARSRPQPRTHSSPICGLARAGVLIGNARHLESSGTDADRQPVLGGDARIWTTWNFTALFRRGTQADFTKSSTEALPRSIPFQNAHSICESRHCSPPLPLRSSQISTQMSASDLSELCDTGDLPAYGRLCSASKVNSTAPRQHGSRQ